MTGFGLGIPAFEVGGNRCRGEGGGTERHLLTAVEQCQGVERCLAFRGAAFRLGFHSRKIKACGMVFHLCGIAGVEAAFLCFGYLAGVVRTYR